MNDSKIYKTVRLQFICNCIFLFWLIVNEHKMKANPNKEVQEKAMIKLKKRYKILKCD